MVLGAGGGVRREGIVRDGRIEGLGFSKKKLTSDCLVIVSAKLSRSSLVSVRYALWVSHKLEVTRRGCHGASISDEVEAKRVATCLVRIRAFPDSVGFSSPSYALHAWLRPRPPLPPPPTHSRCPLTLQ